VDTGELGFHQEIVDGYIIRSFDITMEENQLYWHKDKENRVLYIVDGLGWKIQMDNELPFTLTKDGVYVVPKETFHRLVKGTTNLILKIKEF